MTRREFLLRIDITGGPLYPAMSALGLLAEPVKAKPLKPAGGGQGARILILGAGVAGMPAAYELSQSGCQCTILEARDRSGGSCWTIRCGTWEQETGMPEGTAELDARLYRNAGPACIPQEHTTYLVGWMAGALESARQVVQQLHRRVQATGGQSYDG